MLSRLANRSFEEVGLKSISDSLAPTTLSNCMASQSGGIRLRQELARGKLVRLRHYALMNWCMGMDSNHHRLGFRPTVLLKLPKHVFYSIKEHALQLVPMDVAS